MQTAAALGDAPAPIGATSLDPYGQLIRMLMPRAHSIAIYDRMGVPVWLSEGQDVPELHRLIQDALTGELSEEEQTRRLLRGDRSRSRRVRFHDARRQRRTERCDRPDLP